MSTFSTYTIKDLEALTNIKSHTIRIWEKRYNLLTPKRTETNIRHYSNEDLKKLLNVSFLNQNGIKISKISKLTDEEINEKVRDINISKFGNNIYIENLIIALVELNEKKFVKTLQDATLKMGFEKCVSDVIFPFFKRIGVMWQTGAINPAQEHFASNVIRNKIITATEAIAEPENNNLPKGLLLLPGNELHELGLLYFNYLLKSRGFPTIYLGQAVPLENILRIIEITDPDFMVCSLTNALNKEDLNDVIDAVTTHFQKDIFISGTASENIENERFKNVHFFKSGEDLLKLLKL